MSRSAVTVKHDRKRLGRRLTVNRSGYYSGDPTGQQLERSSVIRAPS